MQAGVVEPAEVLDDGDLGLEAAREGASADELGLQRADEALGHRVVIGVGDRPDGGCDAEVGQPLDVAEARVLAAAIAL